MPDVTRCAWPQSAFRPVWFRRGLNVNLSALNSNPGALCCESSQFNLIAIHRRMCDKIQFAHSFIISVL